MGHKLTSISLIVLFGLMLYVTLWLTQHNKVNTQRQPQTQYDSFVINLKQTQFSKTGNIANHVTTPLLEHYPTTNHTTFTKPNMLVYNDQHNWHITADHGVSQDNNQKIYLSGHVHINQPATKTTPITTITTTHLTVYPQTSIAKTDAFVTLTRPNTVIHGVGAIANMKSGNIKLLSKARGHYAPVTHS